MGVAGSTELASQSTPSSLQRNESVSSSSSQSRPWNFWIKSKKHIRSNSNDESDGTRVSNSDKEGTEATSVSSLLSQFSTAPPSAAVIGGGMAGVHAAYELARLGFEVSVFEQQTEIAYNGGESATDAPNAKSAQPYAPITYSSGSGSTGGSIPFVGTGMLSTSIFDHTVWQHLWKGFFSRSGCPNIVLRDALLPGLMSPEFHQWRRGRRRCLFRDREEVLQYGDRLSRVSREVVAQMVADHPTLAPFLRSSPSVRVANVPSRSSKGNTSNAAIAENAEDTTEQRKCVHSGKHSTAEWLTAHGAPLYLDPVGWTRALAQVCQSLYKVEFFTQHRVEALHVNFRNNTEMISSLTISSPADSYHPMTEDREAGDERMAYLSHQKEKKVRGGEVVPAGQRQRPLLNIANAPQAWVSEKTDEEGRLLSTHRFDVVVIAAGAECGKLCRTATPIPILPVSSVVLSVKAPSPAWWQALGSKLLAPRWSSTVSRSDSPQEKPVAPSSQSFLLTALHPDANLYGYYLPPKNNARGDEAAALVGASSPSVPSFPHTVMSSIVKGEENNTSMPTRTTHPTEGLSFTPSTSTPCLLEEKKKEDTIFVQPETITTTTIRTSPHLSVAEGGDQEELFVNGLFSIDTAPKSTKREAQKRKLLSRLRAYLSVYSDILLPDGLLHGPGSVFSSPKRDSVPHSLPRDAEDSHPPHTSTTTAVHLKEYTQGITPDGLPIIDIYGGYFNTFLCAGFGNRNPDWVPGAAVLLRYLVDRQSHLLRLEQSSSLDFHKGGNGNAAHSEGLRIPTGISWSRVKDTEEGLQQLFHGNYPKDIDKNILSTSAASAYALHPSYSSSTSSTPFHVFGSFLRRGKETLQRGTEWPSREEEKAHPLSPLSSTAGVPGPSSPRIPHSVNPYGTNRFDRLLPLRSNPEKEVRSPIHLLYNWEENYLIHNTEPWLRALNDAVVSFIEADVMPTWLKEFSFYYLYDPAPPSEEAYRKAMAVQHRMRDLIHRYETTTCSPTPVSSPSFSSSASSAPPHDIAPPSNLSTAIDHHKEGGGERHEREELPGIPHSWSARSRQSGERIEREAREFFASGSSIRI